VRRTDRGFTLIEMLVVVLIIGLVATLVAISVGDKPDPAKQKITIALIAKVKGEVQLFKVDRNRYPDSLQELVKHGYLEEIPLDGWGRPFRYACPGQRGPFDIVSLGADGVEGGEGVNADLWSHPARSQ
jgi:general secretion pathway protein G